ncbi:MAG: capsule biosynthesis protein, partial [Bacteroidetes bacterium]|nr:capsule biosynthesis protein [Bacteroidota bacterium]
KYKKRLNNFIRHDINLDVPFVYFPLHFQPEKTTSNWGGIYNDQVLALERLSTAIPPDWKIYIKENPKQNGYMRGKWFFERLKSIPNLIMVPIDMNTYELLDKSQFVATVTGTAGWEAITGGKNALIFGWGVWYKSLPGVFQYEEGMDVTKILNNKIDHSQLEKRFGDLYALMADGVIYRGYETMIPGFDTRDNIKTVIRSLTRIIYQQD